MNYQKYNQNKSKQIIKKYKKNRNKYGSKTYKIFFEMDYTFIQSFNDTKKVMVNDKKGKYYIAFYKRSNSFCEYELLASRLGRLFDIPVAEFELYLDNHMAEGLSISCVQDEENEEFIPITDLLDNDEVSQMISDVKENPDRKKFVADKAQTKHYIDLIFDKLFTMIPEEQLEDIKKDYFQALLFNLLINQKDFNYSNFALIRDKQTGIYRFAPLFDNGEIRIDQEKIDTINISVYRSKNSDVLDLLYNDYYKYIEGFSNKILIEYEKYYSGNKNMFSTAKEIVSDTLGNDDVKLYCDTVNTRLEEIVLRERKRNKWKFIPESRLAKPQEIFFDDNEEKNRNIESR